MTTALDQQLKIIKQKIHYVDQSTKRDSLLFDPTEAASIDIDTYYEIGMQGLKELIGLDSRFKGFEQTLFSPTSISENRILKTEQENQKINIEINEFLRLQSNYFLLNSAQKALEWLIRRYRINEFNIDQIISSIIPFHDSNIFAKFISILQLDFNEKWKILENIVKSKLSVPRGYFITICKNNQFFLEFLCNTIVEYEKSDMISKTLISFFTALIIETLSTMNTVPTKFLRALLPTLNFSLKSKQLDLQLGAFMIIGDIASKTQFKDEIIELFFINTLKNYRNSLQESFTFLIVLFQKQNFKLSNSTLELLISIPTLFDLLNDLNSQNKNLDKLFSILIEYLSSNFIESSECFLLLNQFITELPQVTGRFQKIIIQNILEQQYIKKQVPLDKENQDVVLGLLRSLDPMVLQEEFERYQHRYSKDEISEKLNQLHSQVLLKKTISKIKSNEIFLQLQSTISSERIKGLKQLKSLLEKNPDITDSGYSLSSSLAQVLVEKDSEISRFAWKLPGLIHLVHIDALTQSASQCIESNYLSLDDKKFIVSLLASDKEFQKSNQSALLKVLFPHLISTDLNQEILKSLASLLPSLFKGIKDSSSLSTLFQGINKNYTSSPSEANKFISDYLKEYQFTKSFQNNISNNDLVVLFLILSGQQALDATMVAVVFNFINSFLDSYNDSFSLVIKEISSPTDLYKYTSDPLSIIMNSFCMIIKQLPSIAVTEIQKYLLTVFSKKSSEQQQYQILTGIRQLIENIFNSKIECIDLILRQLIRKYFSNQLVYFKFLTLFWVQPNNTTNNNLIISSLSLLKYLIPSKSFQIHLQQQRNQIILPFLLLLNYQCKDIRSSSLQLLELINETSTNSNNSTTTSTNNDFKFYNNSSTIQSINSKLVSQFLGLILKYKLEIQSDSEFFKTFIKNIVLTQSELKVDIAKYLVEGLLLMESQDQKLLLLKAIQDCQDSYIVTTTLPLLQELFQSYKSKTISIVECSLLDILIRKLCNLSVMGQSKLRKSHNLLQVYIDILSTKHDSLMTWPSGSQYSILTVSISSITKQLVISLALKEQIQLVELLLAHLLSENTEIREVARKVLLSILDDSTTILPMITVNAKSTTPLPIPQYNSMMEILIINSERIQNPIILYTPMIGILKRFNQQSASDATEYCKQLIFRAMVSLTKVLEKNSKELSTLEQLLDIQTIVQSIGTNLQTCNSAMILLQVVSSNFPLKIYKSIDGIISLIKFILGNSQNHDNQTIMNLEGFISSLFPALLKSTTSNVTLTTIFKLFIDSFNTMSKDHQVVLLVNLMKSIQYQQLNLLLTLILTRKIQLLRDITLALKKDDSTMMVDSNKSDDPMEEDNEQQSPLEKQLDTLNAFIREFSEQIPVISLTSSLTMVSRSLNFISLENGTVEQEQQQQNSHSDKEMIQLLSYNSAKDNRLLQASLLDFINERLSSSKYLEEVAFLDHDAKSQIETHYMNSFENLLVLLKKTSESLEISTGSSSSSKGKEKYLKKLQSSIHLCMDKYNQLLSVPGFIVTVSKLLNHQDSSVRRRSLVIFNEKISMVRAQHLEESHVTLFISLLSDFSKIIDTPTETETNKQTALLSFEILARNFSTHSPQVFLQKIASIIKAMGHSSYQVVSSAIICIATLCSELQSKTIPYIPQFFPVILNTLVSSQKLTTTTTTTTTTTANTTTSSTSNGNSTSNSTQTNGHDSISTTISNETRSLLQLSCISSLEIMLNKIPKFLSPYLPQLLNALLHPRLNNTLTPMATKIHQQVKRLLTLITKNIEFRLLLPSMFSAYEFAVVSENDQSIISLFDFVGDISSNLAPKDIALHHKAIFKFYLECFEFRKKYSQRVKNLDSVEEHIINSFLNLVMKLNENLFKPLFIKILDWAIPSHLNNNNNNNNKNNSNGKNNNSDDSDNNDSDSDSDNNSKKKKKLKNNNNSKSNGKSNNNNKSPQYNQNKDNILFFYKLVNALTQNLKSIFLPYFAYFLDDSIYHLKNIFSLQPNITSSSSTANGHQQNGKKRKQEDDKKSQQEQNNQESLLCLIMSAFEKCFINDTDGFLDKQKFELILPALANQLENQMGSSESYKNRVINYLSPTITQLAVAIKQDLLWKHLNHTILMKTRSQSSAVRYSALLVIHSLHKKMGEQLLILLPETIPFISELLEDSSPDVESLCQQVVKTIESHLGGDESISSYL
ncbi:U3 snoRNP protein [Tieghemostelium lacteum]|uniref:HEAT repeat-containing protein 1 n=1 Tax=Tieghemostelium lacteum TaxID=361077 RepID=A0A151ZDD2_TIELA|nr:U3 snoRNP protein [Tieghemostelium lacteum]|eukprot:KYQ91935.1 U3 snoRNP protein [Tieghemostelium lacteum]